MASPFFSGRIPQELYDRIDQHIKETCEGKTQILINALSAYLGVEVSKRAIVNTDLFLSELEQIKDRVTVLEESARSPRKVRNQITQMSWLDTQPENTDNTDINVVNAVITKAEVIEIAPDNTHDDTVISVIRGEQILTTRSISELMGVDRNRLARAREKNSFPIQKGKYSVISYEGKQKKSPYPDLWKVKTTDNE